ncbi:TPA: MobA/MobL family protein [Klebsiella pneumoniae]|uniref:MobQ family relaxase n=1 Tax=Enterobacteriaceae TaxID=543 RepID=UPI00254C1F40|nr:MobQ family relaxase [Klebsiella pneumoniae]HCB2173505.1 MobA/MobL family protein [Klebsiella pneumoniae]HCB2204918.1 MobA/MobL family protein [Klebsiella pneumoniae]HCB2215101.1 MobA/MobL family protein [Klebsiella pneumoniae]HCB2260048.1 MobA/MobL family protein [Klebsiella pneumoniae]HCC5803725.1 MobA/MobL family protein [Klebsiella pneumoniae]
MALYRLEMQNVSRSDGVSSVAKAAYRHRSVMIDERTGEMHGEKSANRDDLVYAEILAPDNTPDFLIKSSNKLWNFVEKTEKRKDARTAKEFKITLPTELSNEQNIKLLKDFLLNHFVDKGIICDFVLHNDKDNKNPHAHVMITTREITPNGFGKKVRSWDEEKTLHEWRKQWARVQNKHLKNAGLKSRVSHRTLEEQKNIMIDLAKKAEDAKDFDKSILYLAKAIELDRPPMQNMSRKKWRTKEGQEQRKRDQAIRDRARADARAFRLLRGVAVVDVASFVVHPLEKKEQSKNNDFSEKKSWWRSTVNFIKNIKAKFSTKKDIKNDVHASDDLMTDPVTGLPITKAKWQEMSDRASQKAPEATISYQVKQSHAESEKTPQNALQSDLDSVAVRRRRPKI